MISAWIYVREGDDILQVEEVIMNVCTIMEFNQSICIRLVATAAEMNRLHLEHFFNSEIHFEMTEEDGYPCLKLSFRFKGGIRTLDDGVIIKELLSNKGKLALNKIEKIKREFTQISEKDMVDIL